ncbi:MAG: zinc-ribbon domain-containing protein [Lachnospiraceae bacterium]|nr:zinc-ribbon domain-containing protein [Lachnospiraceae bacterium]
MRFCGDCGNQMQDTDNVCSQCGARVNKNIRVYYPKSNEPKATNIKAVLALIIGIVSNVFFWLPFLPVITSIIGIVVSIIGIKDASELKSGKGLAIAGLVCSILALIIGGMCTSCYMCFGCAVCSSTGYQGY